MSAWKPGEDTPGPDMYQLYRAADRTSPPAPVIAQAGCTQGLKLIVRPKSKGLPDRTGAARPFCEATGAPVRASQGSCSPGPEVPSVRQPFSGCDGAFSTSSAATA